MWTRPFRMLPYRIGRAWRLWLHGYANRPMNPVVWLSQGHRITVFPANMCTPEVFVEIQPLPDNLASTHARQYGPFPYMEVCDQPLVDRCCWAYMMEFPHILPPNH